MTYRERRLIHLANCSNVEVFDEYRVAILERKDAGYRNRFGDGPSEEILNLEEELGMIEEVIERRGFDIAYARKRAAYIEYDCANCIIDRFKIRDEEEIQKVLEDYFFLEGSL